MPPEVLDYRPVLDHLDLVAPSTAEALRGWPHAAQVEVVAIDPAIADTTSLVEATGMELAECANCVVVGGRRGDVERVAACLVLATTRTDVNRMVRTSLDVRKASFLSMERAVAETGMEYGGITPVGLPADWPVLVDARVPESGHVVIGSGSRSSKLRLPGHLVAELPGARVIENLAS